MKLKAPRGTNDWYPPRGEDLERIQELSYEVFRLFGFRPVRTPTFEATELFQRHIGETSDVVMKEMYTFKDRKGRSLTLRPEGTAPVVRALVERSMLQGGVDRLCYTGPMFRYERPQAGRYREHYQVGVEAFGDPSPEVDVEVIHCFVSLLRKVGLADLEVKLHSVGVPESRARYGDRIREHFAGLGVEIPEVVKERLERNPMRILDDKDPKVREMLEGLPPFLDFLDDADREHFEAVKSGLQSLGVKFRVDPFLVRGFDYYTRTAFEVVTQDLGAQDAVGGGGRYDLLVQELGGQPTPGVGFASGLERILLLLEKKGIRPPARSEPPLAYLVCTDTECRAEGLALASQLRAAGVPARVHYQGGKVGKQLGAADKRGARVAVMLGKREREAGTVRVKDLISGEQQDMAPGAVAAFVRGLEAGE